MHQRLLADSVPTSARNSSPPESKIQMGNPCEKTVEIIVTSGTLDRRELYKPSCVPEVWFWKSDIMRIFCLNAAGEYEEVERSRFLPDLDKALLLRYIRHPDQYDAVNEFVQAIVLP